MAEEQHELEETMDTGEDMSEVLAQEFFFAGTTPTSTHEEWLLRLCSQLMHREAVAVSVLEAQARKAQQAQKWKRSSRGSAESRRASTATGGGT